MNMCKRGVLLSLVLTLALYVMLPFSISADSLSAPFVGFNVRLSGFDHEMTRLFSEDNYLDSQSINGTVSGSLDCSSTAGMTNGGCDVYQLKTPSGASGNLTISLNLLDRNKNQYETDVYTTMNRLWEVEFILDDSYVGYVTFNDGTNDKTIYVNGSSFVQTYWNSSASLNVTISIVDYLLNRNVNSQWNIPNESIISIMGLFQTGFSLYSYNGNDIHIPIFVEDSTKNINNTSVTPTQKKCLVVLYTNHSVYNISTFNQWFTYNSNFECSKISYTQRGQSGWIVQAEFTNNSDSSQTLGLKSVSNSGRFTLIYSSLVYDSYPVSTEFALQFGLTNDFLNAVVYGTTGTNQTASDVTDESSNLTDVSDDIHNMESTFNSDLNNNLQAIDTTVTPGTFGSSFLTSASWVKTQFDQLTSNTPFGSVLSFSLVLGLGLLIVGRALK